MWPIWVVDLYVERRFLFIRLMCRSCHGNGLPLRVRAASRDAPVPGAFQIQRER